MGNSASNEAEEGVLSPEVASSSHHHSSRDRNYTRPKPVPKSRVRLVPISGSPSSAFHRQISRSAPAEQSANMPVYHLTPSLSRAANELTEEEQIKIAQRIGLIDHLPRSYWDVTNVNEKKPKECCICMIDFEDKEPIRYLPCMHYYHLECIDDWLMRSFTCPSCMEPVDGALLSSYGNQASGASV